MVSAVLINFILKGEDAVMYGHILAMTLNCYHLSASSQQCGEDADTHMYMVPTVMNKFHVHRREIETHTQNTGPGMPRWQYNE